MDVREVGPTIVTQEMGRNVNLWCELHAKMNSFCILKQAGYVTLGGQDNAFLFSMESERAQIRPEVGRRAPNKSNLINLV
jgi:hypothetical protein